MLRTGADLHARTRREFPKAVLHRLLLRRFSTPSIEILTVVPTLSRSKTVWKGFACRFCRYKRTSRYPPRVSSAPKVFKVRAPSTWASPSVFVSLELPHVRHVPRAPCRRCSSSVLQDSLAPPRRDGGALSSKTTPRLPSSLGTVHNNSTLTRSEKWHPLVIAPFLRLHLRRRRRRLLLLLNDHDSKRDLRNHNLDDSKRLLTN